MPPKQLLTETPVLKCLRCGSTDTQVVREIPGEGDIRHVDARCVSCREQFVLKHPEYAREQLRG
jgi:hypothetical protein